ncbi:MAG: hypothetical protein IPI43_26040 [Sandaracinaceae bacterium]|nr:hypothetical protein [Sandaracinaceae bacterium]
MARVRMPAGSLPALVSLSPNAPRPPAASRGHSRALTSGCANAARTSPTMLVTAMVTAVEAQPAPMAIMAWA